MNTKMTPGKRILSVLLTLIMVLSMVPMTVFAANGGVAEVITANGATINFNSYVDAVGYANRNGGTLKLLDDITVPYSEELDDIPFITGEFTLDLNEKNINEVVVGSVALDEEGEVIKGTPGTLTVTDSVGNGNIEYLSVNAGALTVAGGAITDLEAESYAATVNITGGTVEQLSLSDVVDEEISATVSGGAVRWLYMNGGTLTVNGGEYPEKINMDLGGGTTNITGGTFADLELRISHGEIRLTGGTFAKISTKLEMGSSEYNEPTLASLLGDGCAFYGTDGGGIVNADVLTLENVRIIADHEHTYKDGKCTTCGALCKHDRVETAMGKCEVCGVQLEAEIRSEGSNPVYYTSFIQAWDALQPNRSDQVTITLLRPGYNLGETNLYVEAKNVRLDLNFHVMFGTGKIIVRGDHSAFTVENGDMNDITVEAADSAVVTVGEDCGSIKAVRVTSTEAAVTIRSGIFEKLELPATDTESLKNIKLSGGYFNSVSFPNAGNSDTVVISDMLEVGYAFKDNKGILKTTPGGLVPYGLTVSAKTYFAELEVVKCEHGEGDDVKGYCKYCGKIYEAKITDKNGDVRYTDTLKESDFGEGNTVMLFRDVKERIIPKSDCTIDLHGHSVGFISFIVDGGTLTLKGYGKITVVVLGYQDTDSTLVIEDASYSSRVEIGTLSINNTTKTKLTGGKFDKIERKDGRFVEDLLPDGYAFFDSAWEMPNYIEGKTSLDKPYFIYIHEHWFIVNIDGETQCQECGMPCHHTAIGEDGKCEDVCKRQIYTAVLTKANGTSENYESFADAWSAAVANEGSTLKLLCDVTLNKAENGIIAQSGKFTFDLNGRTVSGEITNQLLTVSNTADITVKNGKLINTFNTDRSDINLTCANALTINGGTVTLDQAELIAGHGYEGARSCAVYIFSGSLTVVNGTFTGPFGVADVWGVHPSVKITSATLHNGIFYDRTGITAIDYAGLKAFFADGSMLFDKDGKYIDAEDEAYWRIDGEGENTYVSFGYGEECVIKPHTHTYDNGVCSECDYTCPHDNGKNDREAGYFEKAICSVCHCEYGDYVQDTTAPTGKIKIKERSWWQSLLNTVSFGLFYKEEVTVEIIADDDSYSQAGYDAAKHAVKIEYLIGTEPLSEDVVKKCGFNEYTEPFDISDEDQYVIYAKLTDYAGNVAYASTDGFEIDTTAPLIENLENGLYYKFCGEKTLTVTDKNIDAVTLDGTKISLDENGQFTVPADSEKHKIFVTDRAKNETTVCVTVYPSHDFDKTTDICLNCGAFAAAKVEKGEISDRFATGDELFRALEDEKYSGATVTLLKDAEYTERVSLKHDLTIEMNGKSLQTSGRSGFGISSGEVTIRSSVGTADIGAMFGVNSNAHLVMGEGIGKVETIVVMGKLTVYSGSYDYVYTIIPKTKTDDITLYGGTYGKLELTVLGARDALAKGYRFSDLLYADAGDKILNNVTVIPCDHSDLNDFVCTGCGMEILLSAEKNGETTLFGTFERAIRYAEENEGCTIKLLQDLTLDEATAGSLKDSYHIYLEKGRYTFDLAGKTLDIINGNEVFVRKDCDLTIADSVGGGKVISSSGGAVCVGYYTNNNAKLTVTGGEFTVNVTSYNQSALVLKGGSFKKYVISSNWAKCSPFVYLSDGYTFALIDPASGNSYANEGNVEVDHDGSQIIRNVTVVSAPLIFHSQPRDKVYYFTMPNYEKWAAFAVEYSGGYPPVGEITVTGERTDGTVVYTNTVKPTRIFEDAINLWEFTTADSGQYRIKLEYNGYVLYSNTFTITVAECEHPGYDEYNKCSQCHCDLAAAIVKDGKTTGYVTFADALSAAQTDANKGCTLKLLADVNEKVAVKTGEFTLDATGRTINGALNVAKGAALTVGGEEITGNVICAKGGKLTAFGTHFAGTINCVGEGNLRNCKLAGAVTGKSSLKLNSCEIPGNLSISGNAEAEKCTVRGTVTVNNGGSLKSTGGTYGNTVNVKSGGTLEIISGTFDKKLTAEEGSKLIVSGGSYAEVGAENNVDFTLSGGEFTNITVNGQLLIDCLAESKALEDMNLGTVIDGRVGIAGDVKVVDHTHTCVWKTDTHEKLCGCGYVEAVDTEAPVVSGIDPENNHYGSLEFTVTDANDFTVWMDGEEITLVNGKYTMEPDNEIHLITATDIAGNTVSFRFGLFKTYHVTLPTGAGYTIFHSDGLTVRHGNSFSFIVQFNKGYSKTEDFKVLVNGNKLDELMSDADSASFVVRDVSEDLVITVEGVADITAPEVEVNIRGNSFKEFLNRITFGLFFKQTQAVEVKANDSGSGIYKVEYLLSETAFENKDAITGDWTELTLNESRKAYFSIEPSQKMFVYVRVTDESGNIAVVNTDGVVLYTDSEAITKSAEFTMLNNNDVNFNVKLNGNTVKALYNGEEQISAENYTVSEDGTITIKNTFLKTLAAGEYTIRAAYNPMGETYKTGDEPVMTALKLTVNKAEPILGVLGGNLKKEYDGKPIEKAPDYVTSSDGDITIEYKPEGADDSEYSTTVPKNAGRYEFRITAAETDIYKSAHTEGVYEIAPRKVTINGTAVEPSKIYDATTDAKITNVGTLSENFDGENLKIKAGKANYENCNTGIVKTVVFSGFAIEGSAAANYELAAQPESTTAEITAKELRIANLKVKNKQYDGTNTAEIEGIPTLIGLAGGDKLQLLNGTPTFSRVSVGEDIPINFTMFSLFGDSTTLTNYSLKQPDGITANIVEYIADGSEYKVNSTSWINTDFTVTANSGYKLSLTNTADGEWSDTLAASDETANGKITFYVKNTASGAISESVTEDYKIDKTTPTGEIKLNKRSAFKDFINTITFGLFFNDEVEVELTANDGASGVKSVKYFKSDKALTLDEARTVTDWTEGSSFGIKAKDEDKFIIYVRIEDNAGNVNYISSDGATFDTAAPIIEGVENGKTYYTTKQVAVKDTNLDTVTLNGEKAEATLSLKGDKSAKYIIRAEDKAGNVTEYTVTMLPISSVTDAISAITADNVKSSDKETIEGVENRLAAIDKDGATESENNTLQAAAENCKALKDRIAAVAAEILRITDNVNSYDISKVTSTDKSDIEKLVADIDTLLNGNNLTETEKAALETVKATAKALLDRIDAAKSAAESDDITAVDGINKDNVKLGDKDSLENAETALEETLRDFDGNYTEEEQKELESKLETVKEALEAIGNAEKAAEEIAKLPKPDDAKLGDKEDVETVKKIIDGLTENEKEMLGTDEIEKVNNLSERIAELERISFAPSIIEGAGQSWNTKSGENARFRSNAEFSEFRKVLVDGNEIDSGNYIVSEGSTVVELKAEYLKTLSAGMHTLSVVSQNGTATTTFNIVKDADKNSPRTGDTNNLALWLALLFVSGGVMAGTAVVSRKKKHSVK